MFDLGSEILLKTLQLFYFLLIGIVIVVCSKKTTESKEPIKSSGSKTVVHVKAQPSAVCNKVKKIESDDDVKFNLNIKEVEKKTDEFDDDEENPLAKLPIKPRQPKQTKKCGTDGTILTSKTTTTASTGLLSSFATAGDLKTKLSISPGPSKTTSSASPAGATSPEPEKPLFAVNEKEIGSSCYVRLD